MDFLKERILNQKQRLKNRGRIKKFEVVKKLNNKVNICGLHIKGIWPIADRISSYYEFDFINDKGEWVFWEWSTEKLEYPKKGAVEIYNYSTIWIVTALDENMSRIHHYSNTDGKLNGVPKWVVKKGLKDGMHLPLKVIQILDAGLPIELEKK